MGVYAIKMEQDFDRYQGDHMTDESSDEAPSSSSSSNMGEEE